MLHLLNGDAVLPSFRASGIPGDVAVWGDVLWEGPLGRDPSRSAEILARAVYFTDAGQDPAPLVSMQERWDGALADASRHDEVVIWLEHDLHDQFLLVHHLNHFAVYPHPRLTLVCIDRFPGVQPFYGLGQLDGAQLASLFPARQPITEEQLALGARAWAALVAPTPEPIASLLSLDTSALPFLAGAIRRFLEEYPAPVTGLSRTEAAILDRLRSGPATAVELFRETQRREERVFMGDASFARVLRGLSSGQSALLDVEPGAPPLQALPGGTFRMTRTGQEVLDKRADRVAVLGIDRWLGGVHLAGGTAPWRWDRERSRLHRGPARP